MQMSFTRRNFKPSPLTFFIALAACASVSNARVDDPPAARADEITLERIMSDPQWIARSPEAPFWAPDSASLYYRRERAQHGGEEWVHLGTDGEELEVIDGAGNPDLRPRGELDRARARRLYEKDGDLFLADERSGDVRRLTHTSAFELSPRFLFDENRIAFERDGHTFVRSLLDGFEWEPAWILMEDAPEDESEPKAEEEQESAGEDGSDDDAKSKRSGDFLEDQQERLFDHLRTRKRRTEEAAERRKAANEDKEQTQDQAYYLGDEYEFGRMHLSPGARWALVRLDEKGAERGRSDNMPRWVTNDGYVENRSVRSKVGTSQRAGDALVLLDLETHSIHPLGLGGLPGIEQDPLAELRAGAPAWLDALHSGKQGVELPDPRAALPADGDKGQARKVSIARVNWNAAGDRVALQVSSLDNKDSWICLVDLAGKSLASIDHLSDEAWIQWRFRRYGWMPDDRHLWILSEESGYSQLYLYDTHEGLRRRLTQGEWEVSDVTISRTGEFLYFRGNPDHPGRHEFYRIPSTGGPRQQITDLGGRNRAWLSPDEKHVLIEHSEVLAPPELYMQANAVGAKARRLTDTVQPEWTQLPWVRPEIIAVPGEGGHSIHARLYRPTTPADGTRPAVMFVHGAGYLQNAHMGWSNYFREFMFHSLLVHKGYVVLDMDYRASAGYGRDWRTAIYRQMGSPELDDLSAGIDWLVENAGVERTRVGVYGGSYGGFLALMALFTRQDLFACGAALRPVTDWAHYNHGYTANILNTPEVDPEAYWRSSPIEFAEGLQAPLLMCHGMLDDNVFFQDTVRLTQRLIELHKTDWEVAMYPVEPHGFREPASWLDEYGRILKLFERHLAPGN